MTASTDPAFRKINWLDQGKSETRIEGSRNPKRRSGGEDKTWDRTSQSLVCSLGGPVRFRSSLGSTLGLNLAYTDIWVEQLVADDNNSIRRNGRGDQINQSMRLSSTINDNDSDSQGVRTQRRNLQHGEDDMRLVFGVMISLCSKR
jgi:hypothetical protein